jgi:2-keto-3-deoxy-L-rhamnonate aldolase RhmA
MPIRTHRMKQELREGHPVLGCLPHTPEPTIVEALGSASYDYVVLKAEE